MTAISSEHRFRGDFGPIVEAIDAAHDHDWFVVEPYTTRVGIGLQATIIVKNMKTGKGWGLVWRVDAKRLEGMRGNVYHGDSPDCSPSRAFMETFKKRLASEAATLAAVTGGLPVSFHAGRRRHLKAAMQKRAY
jgi:hypothetical protein